MRNRVLWIALLVCGSILAACLLKNPSHVPPQDQIASGWKDLTEVHVRVVWCQDHHINDDVFADGTRLKLMGYDSKGRKGEREILRELGNYNKPMFTPNGIRVVFTDFIEKKAYIVDWDGSNLRQFADGQVLEAWGDPDTGIEWVYVQSGPARGKYFDDNPVYRHPVNNLNQRELVWDDAPVSRDNFQLSADGRRAGGQFPWPQSGVANMREGSWIKTGRGCWTSFAPDNSYLFWIFDGSHRFLTMLSPESDERWKVQVNTAPGMDNAEVYHPRWSSKVRFLTVTGPYTIRRGSNNIRGGGPNVEVFLGRFNDSFTEVEKWVQITHNERADFFPDVWIGGKGKQDRFISAQKRKQETKLSSMWPTRREGLVFLWENRAAENEIIKASQKTRADPVRPQGMAKYGRFHDMNLSKGFFATDTANDHILKACRQSGQLSLEALITPNKVEQKGSASIISYASATSTGNITLGQEGNRLFLKLRTFRPKMNNTFSIAGLYTFTDTKPRHVVVTYKPGELCCYIDGGKVHKSSDIEGNFTAWQPQHLVFGNERDGGHDWEGRIEGIAIYNRAMDKAQVTRNYLLYADRLQKRQPINQIEVLARLKEISETPSLAAIAPYRSALVVYAYEVKRAIRGDVKPRNILVAHWAILNEHTIIEPSTLNTSCRLILERFVDHPELEGERLIMNTDDIVSPLYYDVEIKTSGS